MSARRPSLELSLRVMEKFPATDTDPDLIEAVRLTAEVHVATQRNADRDGRYGRCSGCGQWWPCGVWVSAEQAVRVWLWEASQVAWRRHQAWWSCRGRPQEEDRSVTLAE